MAYPTPEHEIWVARFTGGEVSAATKATMLPAAQLKLELEQKNTQKEAEDGARKDVLLADARRSVEAKREDFRRAYIFQIQVEGKEISTLGEGGDQTLTLDPREAGERLDRAVAMSEMMAAGEMNAFLRDQAEQLRAHRTFRYVITSAGVVPGDEEPLLAEGEIRDEIFTPLVREQLIPEQFISDQFSEVQQMLDRSNEFYREELASYQEKESTIPEDIKTLVKAGAEFATVIEGLTLGGDSLKTAKAMTKLAASVVTTAADGYQATRQQSLAGLQTTVGGIAGIAGSLIGGDLGKIVKLGIESAMNVGVMVVHVTKEGGPDVDALLQDLINGVGEAFTGAGLATSSNEKKADITAVAASVKLVLGKMLAAKKGKILDKVREGRWDVVAKLASSAMLQAVQIGFQHSTDMDKARVAAEAKAEEITDEEADEEKDELDEIMDAAKESIAESTEAFGEAFDAIGERTEELERLEEARKKEFEAAEQLAAEEESARERERYETALHGLGSANPDEAELKSISYLIAKLEKDKALINIAKGIANAGGAVVDFFQPMAHAGTLVAFLGNLHSAYERMQAMRKWSASHGEAIAAVSPYATTVQNFVKNQKEQFAHYTAKAVLSAIKAGAQFASNAVVIAHFAKAAEAGAALAETLEDLIYRQYQKSQVDKAWEMTKAALKDPQNRRLGLMARRLNPTLAKYTIAYGAVVKRDAIAVSAMNRIGLDRETLAMKSSGVSEVKRFLDTLYEDDQTVLGEFDDEEWAHGKPPEPVLELRAWLQTVQVMKENNKVSESAHGEIVRGLKAVAKFERATEAALAARDPDEPERERHREALLAMDGALGDLLVALVAYRPTLAGGMVATAGVEIAGRYRALADALRVEVRQGLLLLAAAPVGG